MPPGAKSVRIADGDAYTYDEQELFGALSDSDEEATESGPGTELGYSLVRYQM